MNKNLDRYISASILCDVSWEREEHFRNTTVFWFSLYVWFVMIGIAKGGGGARGAWKVKVFTYVSGRQWKRLWKIGFFGSYCLKTGLRYTPSYLRPKVKKILVFYFGNLMLQNTGYYGKFPNSFIFKNIITVRTSTNVLLN